jgi:hypothetical protein
MAGSAVSVSDWLRAAPVDQSSWPALVEAGVPPRPIHHRPGRRERDARRYVRWWWQGRPRAVRRFAGAELVGRVVGAQMLRAGVPGWGHADRARGANRPVYAAIGVSLAGEKDILGL